MYDILHIQRIRPLPKIPKVEIENDIIDISVDNNITVYRARAKGPKPSVSYTLNVAKFLLEEVIIPGYTLQIRIIGKYYIVANTYIISEESTSLLYFSIKYLDEALTTLAGMESSQANFFLVERFCNIESDLKDLGLELETQSDREAIIHSVAKAVVLSS